VDRIVAEASLNPRADGDLAAAARRIRDQLSAKARTGLTAFLDAVAAGASVLAPEEAAADAASPGAAVRVPAEGKKTAGKRGAAQDAAPEDAAGKRASRKREGLSAGEGLSVCVVRLILEAGIAGYHLTHDEIAGNQRIANLQELANAASLYPPSRGGLLEFLEHIELDRAMESAGSGDTDDVVTLITLHNTKGLEFRRVIITGVEQGIFPRDDKQDDDLEEERRLFYVGATRAMDELYLSSCAMRRMFGRTMPMEPSIFLREVDKSALRIIGNAPYGFTPSGSGKAARGGSYGTGGGGSYGPGQGAPNGAGGPYNPAAVPGAASSDGRWRVGDRLFHDDHGYGGVVEIRETEDGPVVKARFESGAEVRFLSLHQSSRFTRIGED
jgi:DNA helicase-2/ATP-dependent DNA helicase PcrA